MNNIPKGIQKQGYLTWDIGLLAEAMQITPKDVHAYFTDGRRVSFIMERRIAYEVIGGTLAASEGAGFDLLDREGGKWEVRSITKSGIYFCPSYMVGSRRKFEEQGFLNKLDEIRGYVLSDVQSFPNIPYWIISESIVRNWWNKGMLGNTTKITRNKALALIQGME